MNLRICPLRSYPPRIFQLIWTLNDVLINVSTCQDAEELMKQYDYLVENAVKFETECI